METFFTDTLNEVYKYIHPLYLAVFMLLSYTFKNPLHALISGFFQKVQSKQWAVLIIGLATGVIFWFLGAGKMQIVVTFAVGTSVHDYIFSYIEKWLKNK